jgi:hypothetical protein
MEPAIPKHHPGHPDTNAGTGGCECGGGGSVVEKVGVPEVVMHLTRT